MQKPAFNRGLLDYLKKSPTPFHAVTEIKEKLISAEYTALYEQDSWSLKAGGDYFVTRNDSSIIAFRLGSESPVTNGFRMVGAHTDSPCLKLKPNPEINKKGYEQFGVEVYGGVLLNPWFDRDLSLAGRVTFHDKNDNIVSRIIDFEKAIAIIPSLAIHLDREVNENRSINKQTDLPPILSLASEESLCIHEEIKSQLIKLDASLKNVEILDFELMFYDTNSPTFVGLKDEFIASARLDNLLSCYTGLQALLSNKSDACQLLVCNDHEEVGSGSTSGARGNFLSSILHRISETDEAYSRMIAHSMLISTDNAHGVHPNYSDKHDGNHGPLINKGPVIKINSNQAYASNSETVGLFCQAARIAKEATQSFVIRTDLACGSTIGPLTATALGVKTIDVGVPTFAMHSIRELAGSDDAYALYKILLAFNGMGELSISTGQ